MKKENIEKINELMNEINFKLVDFDKLSFNHKEELGYYNQGTYLLFRGTICVDHYILFEFETYRNQVMFFGKCRECNSNNYIKNSDSSYYLTKEHLDIVGKCMNIIEKDKLETKF